MSKNEISNISHSVNARLKNLAVKNKIPFDYILLRYAFERFLFRLSISQHADRFILKGASVFSVWLGPIFRVTRDTDLLCSGNSDPEFLLQCFKDICGETVPADGVIFDLNSMSTGEIKKDQRYRGTRITFSANIAQARVELQFDIGFGDTIFPSAEFSEYPVLLDMEKPRIKVYPQYTVIAEKFEAMVTLGMKNSRLKDFYDIWLLSECFEFDFIILMRAIEQTFARRSTPVPTEWPIALTSEFFADAIKLSQWTGFLRKVNPQQQPDSLAEAIERIKAFLNPIISLQARPPKTWIAGKGWE